MHAPILSMSLTHYERKKSHTQARPITLSFFCTVAQADVPGWERLSVCLSLCHSEHHWHPELDLAKVIGSTLVTSVGP